jgi:xylulokinase
MAFAMADALIGLDLGTTVCKGILVDRQLNILSRADSSYPLITRTAEQIEQNAGDWWNVSKSIIQRIVAEAALSRRDIRGICVSAQGISFVPVNREGAPLRNALSWLDTRAKEQTDRVLADFGEKESFSVTGKRVSSVYLLPKLLWLRDSEPEVYRKAHKILMAMDFLLARLCGAFVTDHTMASGTLLYDLHRQDWSAQILDRFGLASEKLPEIRWSGSRAGTVSRETADELGLSPHTAVVVGGQDQKVSALGAGIDLERTTICLGTAMAITQKCTKPVIDQAMRIPCFSDLFPGHWVLEGSGIGTSCLDWFRNTLLPEKAYEELEGMVLQLDGTENRLYFYPHLAGTSTLHFGEDLRGFLYGLDFSVTAGRMVKSVFEGIAYQIREQIDLMERISRPVHELRLFGGGSKSGIWAQIIADVCAKPVVTFSSPDMGCLGAAILAGIGAGVFSSREESANLVRIDRRIEPRDRLQVLYERQYLEYIAIQRRMTAEVAS